MIMIVVTPMTEPTIESKRQHYSALDSRLDDESSDPIPLVRLRERESHPSVREFSVGAEKGRKRSPRSGKSSCKSQTSFQLKWTREYR